MCILPFTLHKKYHYVSDTFLQALWDALGSYLAKL